MVKYWICLNIGTACKSYLLCYIHQESHKKNTQLVYLTFLVYEGVKIWHFTELQCRWHVMTIFCYSCSMLCMIIKCNRIPGVFWACDCIWSIFSISFLCPKVWNWNYKTWMKLWTRLVIGRAIILNYTEDTLIIN